MKAESYSVTELELSGWPVRITSYRIGKTWHAKADNVSPGANIARAKAEGRQQAEAKVIERASERLGATRRRPQG
ncbi:MAG: hypothetical protein OXJ37_23475 [Bryobacterales bacterium]|nr:hypothetical protein [Bryobacterales bacterium]